MKSWDLANSVLREFYPSLLPGVSHIIHQDFAHLYTPWIHLTHFRLREYFVPMYEVPMSGSVVFRLEKAIPGELLEHTYAPGDFTSDEVNAAFDYSLSLVSAEKHASIVAAKVMHYVNIGNRAGARHELGKWNRSPRGHSPDLAIAENWLRESAVGSRP